MGGDYSRVYRCVKPGARRYVCQRRREDVEAWFQDDAATGRAASNPFPRRDQDEVIVPPTAYEMDAIRAVEAYGQRVLQQESADSVQPRALASWTVMHLHKRALSLSEALSIQGLERLLRDAVEARRRELVAERERIRDQMQAVV